MSDVLDKAVANALAERVRVSEMIEDAQRKIALWKQEIDRIDVFVSDWYRFAGVKPPASVSDVERTAPAIEAPTTDPEFKSETLKRPTKNSKKEDVAKAAREIILEKGEAVQPLDLFEALVSRGLVIEGTDPKGVMTTMLWRTKDHGVVRLAHHGYWLADQPYMRAGYDPHIPYLGDQEHADMVSRELSGTLPDTN